MRLLLGRVLLTAGVLALALAPFGRIAAEENKALVLTPEQIEKVRVANNECLSCHSEAGIEHPPQEGLDLKALRTFLKDPEAFKGADHRQLACTKCHNEGYDDFPHEPDAKDMTSTCTDCHSKKADLIEKEVAKSVHADLGDKIVCTTCHDPHVMRLAENLVDPHKIVAQDNRVCLGCHDSDVQFARFAPEKKSRPLIDDIHSWLPNTRLHWKAVRCVECHTPAVAANEPISHQILNKEKAERKCLACHSANTSLKTRLYRHLVKQEQHTLGFANSIILANSYVIGVTQHPLLDTLILIAFGSMVLALLAHGLGHFVARRFQRRKNNG